MLTTPNSPDDKDSSSEADEVLSPPDAPATVESADGASGEAASKTAHGKTVNVASKLIRQLGNRWTFPILEALDRGPVRFAQLKRTIGPVSQRMLTLSLRKLERDGIVYRHEVPGQPPQVSYGLTRFGEALNIWLKDFNGWVRVHSTLLEKLDADNC